MLLASLALLLTAQQRAEKEDRGVWLAGVPIPIWKALHAMGLEDKRVQLVWASAAEGQQLAEAIEAAEIELRDKLERARITMEIAVDRERILSLLLDLHEALDAALRSETPEAASTVEDLVTRLERAERERTDQLARERLLVDRIHERLLEMGATIVTPSNRSAYRANGITRTLIPKNSSTPSRTRSASVR